VFGSRSRGVGIKHREVDSQLAVWADSEAFANIASAYIPQPEYVIEALKQLRTSRMDQGSAYR
jgi:hypothetical protein